MPKRYTVDVPTTTTTAPPQQAPAAPPSSREPPPPLLRHSSNLTATSTASKNARTKPNATRQRVGGGLVHGTGRVKANGALKRTSSPPSEPAAPAAPTKQRTVIDQSPVPLYCSDKCRLADLNEQFGAYTDNFRPEESQPRSTSGVLAVPTRKASAPVDADSDAASSSSSSTACSSEHKSISTANSWDEMDPSIAVLAAHYGFPPLPPLPPASLSEEASRPAPPARSTDYQSGIMMAARRIQAVLAPPQPKKTSSGSNPAQRMTASRQARDRKPIPGWTDGTDAWRAEVYSMSRPQEFSTDPRINEERMGRAYRSFAASPHRSQGVYSTVSDSPVVATAPATSAPSARMEELLANYPLSNASRSNSRAQLFPGMSQSVPGRCESTMSRRREGILKPGAEGKLLVPDIKMRRTPSGSSITTVSSARSPRMRPLVRRGSAMSDDVISEEGEPAVVPRPAPGMRYRYSCRARLY
jgi:hypothetical protein